MSDGHTREVGPAVAKTVEFSRSQLAGSVQPAPPTKALDGIAEGLDARNGSLADLVERLGNVVARLKGTAQGAVESGSVEPYAGSLGQLREGLGGYTNSLERLSGLVDALEDVV